MKRDDDTLGEGEIKFKINKELCESESQKCSKGGGCSAVYGLGLLGALWYFISNSTSFWNGVVGILKALVWPAFLVHGLLGMLGL